MPFSPSVTTGDDEGCRQAVRYGDQQVERGHGGETHQIAAEGGPRLTTQQGTVVSDDQNTLRAGERGPGALEDFHFREKIFHFDHERIPERVVHARGYGARGADPDFHRRDLWDAITAGDFPRVGARAAVVRRRLRRSLRVRHPGPDQDRARKGGPGPPGRPHGHGQPAGPGQLRAQLLGPARAAGGPGGPLRTYPDGQGDQAGPKRRLRPESFADHYSQARQFFISQTETEQQHITDAFVFELSKCGKTAIRSRMVAALRNVDEDLARSVADGLGLAELPDALPPAREPVRDLAASPALSILANGPDSFAGRKLGILVTDGADTAKLASAAEEAKVNVELVAPAVGGIDIPVRAYKVCAAWVGEKAGRVKFNGRLLSRSPLSDLEELELLRLGVEGKAAGWRTLRALADTDERLDPGHLDELMSRARRQADLLEELRVRAAEQVISS